LSAVLIQSIKRALAADITYAQLNNNTNQILGVETGEKEILAIGHERAKEWADPGYQ
jgi:hypothetical protein